MSAESSIGLNLQSGQFVANWEIEVERAMGIEPTSVVGWEGGLAATLPPQNRA